MRAQAEQINALSTNVNYLGQRLSAYIDNNTKLIATRTAAVAASSASQQNIILKCVGPSESRCLRATE